MSVDARQEQAFQSVAVPSVDAVGWSRGIEPLVNLLCVANWLEPITWVSPAATEYARRLDELMRAVRVAVENCRAAEDRANQHVRRCEAFLATQAG